MENRKNQVDVAYYRAIKGYMFLVLFEIFLSYNKGI